MTTRLEAAVKAWDHYWGDRYGDEALEEMGDEVKVALDAADAHDAAHGIHRVTLDDATVERAAEALYDATWDADGATFEEAPATLQDHFRLVARTVLAAAVEAGQ